VNLLSSLCFWIKGALAKVDRCDRPKNLGTCSSGEALDGRRLAGEVEPKFALNIVPAPHLQILQLRFGGLPKNPRARLAER
jgi:hypothetical protein